MNSKKDVTYRISTITATANIGSGIDLDILYNAVKIDDVIKYIEYNSSDSQYMYKGETKKKKKPGKKSFNNQVSIVFKPNDEKYLYGTNMKVFKNGKIQMTGLRDISKGPEYIDIFINYIKKFYEEYDSNIVTDIEKISNMDYKVALINTDTRIGFSVNRTRFYSVLLNKYKIMCTYEELIYPGIKCSYMYNKDNPLKDGICYCTNRQCFTKKTGKGCGDDNCKKITIIIFKSGSIIVTGGLSKEQIDECYEYIFKVVKDNIDIIVQKSI